MFKDKLKKFAKVTGLVALIGLACWGALSAVLLAVGSGNKKEDSSLRSPVVYQSPKMEGLPKKAPNFEGSDNLLLDSTKFGSVANREINFWNANNVLIADGRQSYTCYASLNVMPKGLYFVWFSQDVYTTASSFIYTYDWDDGRALTAGVLDTGHTFTISKENFVVKSNSPIALVSLEGPAYMYACGQSVQGIFLADSVTASAMDTIFFPESWSPFLPVTDELTSNNGYGYLKLDSASSSTLVPFKVDLTDLIILYGGVVYDTISFHYRDLSYGIGYIRDDGTPYLPANGTPPASDVRIIGLWVTFSNSVTGDSIEALSPVYDSTPFGEVGDTYYPYPYYLPNGSYRWALKDSKIEVLFQKRGVATGRYGGRYTQYTDLEFLKLMGSYNSTGLVVSLGDNGTYNVFNLFTSAFEGMLPILSVPIVGGISLGLLLMLPLVAGIVVLVIRAVKK